MVGREAHRLAQNAAHARLDERLVEAEVHDEGGGDDGAAAQRDLDLGQLTPADDGRRAAGQRVGSRDDGARGVLARWEVLLAPRVGGGLGRQRAVERGAVGLHAVERHGGGREVEVRLALDDDPHLEDAGRRGLRRDDLRLLRGRLLLGRRRRRELAQRECVLEARRAPGDLPDAHLLDQDLIELRCGRDVGRERHRLAGAELLAQRLERVADIRAGQHSGQRHGGAAPSKALIEVARQRRYRVHDQIEILVDLDLLCLRELERAEHGADGRHRRRSGGLELAEVGDDGVDQAEDLGLDLVE